MLVTWVNLPRTNPSLDNFSGFCVFPGSWLSTEWIGLPPSTLPTHPWHPVSLPHSTLRLKTVSQRYLGWMVKKKKNPVILDIESWSSQKGKVFQHVWKEDVGKWKISAPCCVWHSTLDFLLWFAQGLPSSLVCNYVLSCPSLWQRRFHEEGTSDSQS